MEVAFIRDGLLELELVITRYGLQLVELVSNW